MNDIRPLVVNGCTLFAHPLFLDQLDALTAQVEALKPKDPVGYGKKMPRRGCNLPLAHAPVLRILRIQAQTEKGGAACCEGLAMSISLLY